MKDIIIIINIWWQWGADLWRVALPLAVRFPPLSPLSGRPSVICLCKSKNIISMQVVTIQPQIILPALPLMVLESHHYTLFTLENKPKKLCELQIPPKRSEGNDYVPEMLRSFMLTLLASLGVASLSGDGDRVVSRSKVTLCGRLLDAPSSWSAVSSCCSSLHGSQDREVFTFIISLYYTMYYYNMLYYITMPLYYVNCYIKH